MLHVEAELRWILRLAPEPCRAFLTRCPQRQREKTCEYVGQDCELVTDQLSIQVENQPTTIHCEIPRSKARTLARAHGEITRGRSGLRFDPRSRVEAVSDQDARLPANARIAAPSRHDGGLIDEDKMGRVSQGCIAFSLARTAKATAAEPSLKGSGAHSSHGQHPTNAPSGAHVSRPFLLARHLC